MSLYPKEISLPDGSRYPGLHPDTGKFTSGDATRGIPASALPSETVNLILDNLQGLIQNGLEESNPKDGGQLLRGLEAIIQRKVHQQVKDSLAEGVFCPIPVGSLHVQFPDQPLPADIWEGTFWENFSHPYGGDFFRVEGGQALGFGEGRQGDAAQRITGRISGVSETFAVSGLGSGALFKSSNNPVRGNTPSRVDNSLTGTLTFDSALSLSPSAAKTDDFETRPVNQTIRIWKRVPQLSGNSEEGTPLQNRE